MHNKPANVSRLLLVAMLFPAFAQAANKQCPAAATPVDRMVCRSPSLSALDDRMRALFERIDAETRGVDGDTGATRSPFADEHRAWMMGVRNRCTTEACLQSAYRRRIADVETRWKDAL